MPTLTITYSTESERLQYERAIAYVQEMMQLGANAPAGTVINSCELLALARGRQLLRDNLEAAIQARADSEKKSPVHAPKARKRGRSSPHSGPSR